VDVGYGDRQRSPTRQIDQRAAAVIAGAGLGQTLARLELKIVFNFEACLVMMVRWLADAGFRVRVLTQPIVRPPP